MINIYMKLKDLQEAKYHGNNFKGDWDSMTKQTNPNLSPAERGQIAGYADQSLDYNEKTDEYNPYPLNTKEFEEYEQAFIDAVNDMTERYPDI